MRMMMKVLIPVEAGNRSVKDGMLQKTVMAFTEKVKPEACYFTSEGGKRTAFFVFDLKDSPSIPSLAEPFFLNLNASVDISPAMNLEEMKAGVDRAMKQG